MRAHFWLRCDNRFSRVFIYKIGLTKRYWEIYGWLLGHYAVRSLMFEAAEQAGISPLRLGFTGSLNVIKRSISDFQGLKPEQLPFFFSKLIIDILDEQIPFPSGRSNPRVVKKPRSKFPAKKPIHRGTGVKKAPLSFTILSTA